MNDSTSFERRLLDLFDRQRFFRNSALDALIAERFKGETSMEDNKKFELGDDALEEVAGGIGGPEYAGTKTLVCTGCRKTVQMQLLRDADIDGLFAQCPECGQYNWDL